MLSLVQTNLSVLDLQANIHMYIHNFVYIHTYIYRRGVQRDQLSEPHFRRQQWARAMKVQAMSYIWKMCDNN
jgi:hypothetical protein